MHYFPKNKTGDKKIGKTAGMYSKPGTNVPYGVPTKCCYFYVDSKSKMAALVSDWLIHFQFLLKNSCRDLLQTWCKCSYGVRTECCYLFLWIRNLRWPPWPLIGWPTRGLGHFVLRFSLGFTNNTFLTYRGMYT